MSIETRPYRIREIRAGITLPIPQQGHRGYVTINSMLDEAVATREPQPGPRTETERVLLPPQRGGPSGRTVETPRGVQKIPLIQPLPIQSRADIPVLHYEEVPAPPYTGKSLEDIADELEAHKEHLPKSRMRFERWLQKLGPVENIRAFKAWLPSLNPLSSKNAFFDRPPTGKISSEIPGSRPVWDSNISGIPIPPYKGYTADEAIQLDPLPGSQSFLQRLETNYKEWPTNEQSAKARKNILNKIIQGALWKKNTAIVEGQIEEHTEGQVKNQTGWKDYIKELSNRSPEEAAREEALLEKAVLVDNGNLVPVLFVDDVTYTDPKDRVLKTALVIYRLDNDEMKNNPGRYEAAIDAVLNIANTIFTGKKNSGLEPIPLHSTIESSAQVSPPSLPLQRAA